MQNQKLKKIVSIFIYSQNQLLLALRDNKKEIVYPECWGLISGSLNIDENPYSGIKREIKEEISISNIKKLKFIETYISKKENIIYYVFKTYLKNTRNIKLKEGIEYSFFSKSEFLQGYKFSKKLNKICFIVDNPFMKKYYFKTL